jgi:hypothetical protein
MSPSIDLATKPQPSALPGDDGPIRRKLVPLFHDIGTEIERSWTAAGSDLAVLPDIASGVLHNRQPHRDLSVTEIVGWVLDAVELPEQRDVGAIFGEPPVSVYNGPTLEIQVLCWRAGTTAIHRHRFVGAFAVIEGVNLHTRYSFEPRHVISPTLQVGDVRLTDAELLDAGDVVPITPDLKHNVFHLEEPSATLVIRSTANGPEPQFDYFTPSVAFDPFRVDPLIMRRVQVLRLLLHTGRHQQHDDLAAELLATCDLATTWDVLEQSMNEIPDVDRAQRLAEIARRRHGAVIDDFLAVIDEQRRMERARRLHAAVNDPDLRFFIALLHSLPSRDVILELVAQRYGVDPRVRVREWLTQLSGVDLSGVDLSDEVNRQLVDAMLDGFDDAGQLERLSTTFDRASVLQQSKDICRHRQRIEATVLAPLFRASPPPTARPGRSSNSVAATEATRLAGRHDY